MWTGHLPAGNSQQCGQDRVEIVRTQSLHNHLSIIDNCVVQQAHMFKNYSHRHHEVWLAGSESFCDGRHAYPTRCRLSPARRLPLKRSARCARCEIVSTTHGHLLDLFTTPVTLLGWHAALIYVYMYTILVQIAILTSLRETLLVSAFANIMTFQFGHRVERDRDRLCTVRQELIWFVTVSIDCTYDEFRSMVPPFAYETSYARLSETKRCEQWSQ